MSSIIVAIDGPSASGKSSTSRLVAEALNFKHVDTGSIYRAFTWKVLEEGIDPSDTDKVISLLNRVRHECDFIEGAPGLLTLRNLCDGTVIPPEALRTPRVESSVSTVSAIPRVRERLVQKQRDLAMQGDLVAEGRDIGTVVFPNTPFKFYLDASPEVRARRRAKDQNASDQAQIKSVSEAIAQRDRLDSTRKVAPLKVADDAIRIDTSDHTPQTTSDIILKHIRSRHLTQN